MLRFCFVTTGATAGFDSLVRAALSPPFLEALEKGGYTDLLIQHGTSGSRIFDEFIAADKKKTHGRHRLRISGFDFKKEGLASEMQVVKGGAGRLQGVVISHAGTGSILAARRMSIPIVVVPNSSLLNNHQVELAEALAAQGQVIYGCLDALPEAIRVAELQSQEQVAWPAAEENTTTMGRRLKHVMDEEMGFVDRFYVQPAVSTSLQK